MITVSKTSGVVTIDGKMNLSLSRSLEIVGLDVTDSAFTDRSGVNSDDGVAPGEDLVLRNCIIRNHYNGFLGGAVYKNITLDGCIVYYNGNDSNQGHGLYIQHNDLGGLFIVRNCIVHNNFGYGIHCYASIPLYDFLVENNIVFESGSIRSVPMRNILAGGSGGIYNVTIRGNKLWYRDTNAGEGLMVNWGLNNAQNITVQNNVIVGGSLALRLHNNPEITDMSGNAFYGGFLPAGTDAIWPNNIYGTYASHPDAVYLGAYPSDSTRANLTVFNPSQADSVSVDVSSVFNAGDTIKAHNAQDYFTDIQTLTVVQDGTISVNMQVANRTVETPVGWAAPATTAPQFGAFILERQ